MVESFSNPSEVSNNDLSNSFNDTDNKLDTSQALDFSNNSDFGNSPTEKDGNKETEGQIKENSIMEANKPDTSQALDLSRSEIGDKSYPDASNLIDLSENNESSFEKDDNGKVYKENGELLPNNEYTIRGYDYKTDDQGRIVSASGDLRWKDHEGRLEMPDNIHDIGKGDERSTDDRGHLIADEFNGSGGKENLVPMDSYLNQHGDYRNLEKEWEQKLAAKENVYVEIDVDYNGDSRRPEAFTVGYDTGGEHYEKTFLNEDSRGEL